MNQSRSSYGGKVGVWISHKHSSKKRIQSWAHPHRHHRRSTTRSRSSSTSSTNILHNNAVFSQYSHHSSNFFRHMSSRLSSIRNGKDHDLDPFLVGWDEVNCRPVYYTTSNTNYVSPTACSHDTCSKFDRNIHELHRLQDTQSHEPMMEHWIPSIQDKDEEINTNSNTSQMNTSPIFVDYPKSKVKKSYGSFMNNRYRKGRLSSLANAVLENVASPNGTSLLNYQNKTKKYTPLEGGITTVTDKSHRRKNEGGSNPQQDIFIPMTDSLDFQSVHDNSSIESHHDPSSSTESKVSSRKRKHPVPGRKDATSKTKVQDVYSPSKVILRQPSSSTSLAEARAFFEQLDREELKIVSS